jgi:hypothetical protein
MMRSALTRELSGAGGVRLERVVRRQTDDALKDADVTGRLLFVEVDC